MRALHLFTVKDKKMWQPLISAWHHKMPNIRAMLTVSKVSTFVGVFLSVTHYASNGYKHTQPTHRSPSGSNCPGSRNPLVGCLSAWKLLLWFHQLGVDVGASHVASHVLAPNDALLPPCAPSAWFLPLLSLFPSPTPSHAPALTGCVYEQLPTIRVVELVPFVPRVFLNYVCTSTQASGGFWDNARRGAGRPIVNVWECELLFFLSCFLQTLINPQWPLHKLHLYIKLQFSTSALSWRITP